MIFSFPTHSPPPPYFRDISRGRWQRGLFLSLDVSQFSLFSSSLGNKLLSWPKPKRCCYRVVGRGIISRTENYWLFLLELNWLSSNHPWTYHVVANVLSPLSVLCISTTLLFFCLYLKTKIAKSEMLFSWGFNTWVNSICLKTFKMQ